MKATTLEFRFRFVIHIVIYLLGFFTPWNRLLHLDDTRTAWLFFASWPSSHHWLSFTAATVAVLVLAILFAFAAVTIRVWGCSLYGSFGRA